MKIFLAVLLLTLHAQSLGQKNMRYKDGDIIFQTSLSAQSKAIQDATKSKWSHMGIIFIVKEKPYVYEAIAHVKFTPLQAWINRGKNKLFAVKRLKERDKYLTPLILSELRKTALGFKGRPYDDLFEWTDKNMYCSELVWKIYYQTTGIRLAELQSLGEFDLTSPAVKQKLRARYGKHIPYNESVISPEQIFQSPLLETIKPG